jgi:V-type H+-transporting ATPase subunit d
MLDQTGMGGNSSSGGMGNEEGKSLEDLFYRKEMEIAKLAFTYQFTHAVVYAWVKLREQVSLSSGRGLLI